MKVDKHTAVLGLPSTTAGPKGGRLVLPSVLGGLRFPNRRSWRTAIPRYFFNIYDGQDIFDDTGTELDSAHEIRLHMIATALALFEDEERQEAHWKMEALDERGQIIGTMAFGVKDEKDAA